MRLVVAAAVFLSGCSGPRDCSIDAVEFEFAGSGTLHNCGELHSDGLGVDIAAYQAAQACVVDHAQHHLAFFAGWTAQGVDTFERYAYIGTTRGGAWQVSAFEEDGGAINGISPAERDSCTDLIAGSACSSWEWDLCVECVGRKTADACMP